MKRVHLALVAVLALIAGLIATVPAQAKDVNFVEGLLKGKFGMYQAYDVKPTPEYPTCSSDTSYSSFKVHVRSAADIDNPNNPLGAPYSYPQQAPYELGNSYLSFFETGDSNFPWGVKLFNTIDQELRFDTSTGTWITEPTGGWTDVQKVFTAKGNILGVTENGFFYVSENAPGETWGYGTYFSVTTPLTPGQDVTYTPSPSFNTCKNLTQAGQNVATANPDAMLKTYWVSDNPLGPPTNDATVRMFLPSVGEIEGQVKPTNFSYDWGISFDYSNFTTNSLRIFPTNPASPIKVADKIYRSGQPIAIPPVAVGTPFDLKFTVYSVDGSVSKDYTVVVRAWPGRLPQVTKLSTRYAQNTGGQKIDISGKYLNFTKGAYFTPLEDPDIYGSRAVVATREDKKYKWVTDRTSWTYAPAVPKPGGGNYTGTYNVILDTPYGNTEVDPNIASITYQNPQKPLTALQFAKKITQGVTKLLGLPIKMNSGSIPKIKFSVRFGKRAKPIGDFALYEITKRSDGYYINWKTAQRGTVTAVVTAKRTQKYAPYYKEKVWKTK